MEWKDLIIVPFYKKGCKTGCSNYSGISGLSTIYKIVSNILLSRFKAFRGNYCVSVLWISMQQVNC